MPARKTKVAIKAMPDIADWLLRNATGEQLDYLHRLVSSSEFRLLVNLVQRLKDYNIYQYWKVDVKDPVELLVMRAASRGEVAGLDALLFAAQGAKMEKEKRRRAKLEST